MKSPTAEPLAITGLGVILPGATSVAEFWSHLSSGRPQLREITRFVPAAEDIPVSIGGEIGEVDYEGHLPELAEKHAKKYSREILATIASTAMAQRDAGLHPPAVEAGRVSVIQSTSRGTSEWWLTDRPGDTRYADSGAMFQSLTACPASLSAMSIGAGGPAITLSSACVGGHHALGVAADELRSGRSDAVIVGGHEFPLVPDVIRCFLAMGPVLTTRKDAATAVRPYSRDRDGMALGEAAVAMCLERASSARQRGARAYANVLSERAQTDGTNAVAMDTTGQAAARLVGEALESAGVSVDQVGYYCGHGTATQLNDLAESRMLRALYPERPMDRLPPLGSNKPIFGHTLGVAGIVNVAATALMIRHQRLAPTVNIGPVAAECDHDHVAEGARDADLEAAVSLTFAVGGQTAVTVLGRA